MLRSFLGGDASVGSLVATGVDLVRTGARALSSHKHTLSSAAVAMNILSRLPKGGNCSSLTTLAMFSHQCRAFHQPNPETGFNVITIQLRPSFENSKKTMR